MTDQKQYRLLNEGDTIQRDDEYYANDTYIWRTANVDSIGSAWGTGYMPYRRPIVPAPTWPEAKSVKEAMPPEGPVLYYAEEANCWFGSLNGKIEVTDGFWIPQPPAPPVLEPWQLAYESYYVTGMRSEPVKIAFRAGYEAAQKGDGE